jgi:multidrug efflux pump subunit AcrA (membrane-fusion protein)
VARTLKATGSVAAYELIPILSQATGLQIKEIFVDEGDIVSQGQILARLDDTVLQAQLTQAQANVAQSRARLAELQAGSRKEEIARAKQTIQRIKAEISQAQSDWDLAKKRVQRNQSLEAEGAIARDRLDEVLNEERNQAAIVEQTQSRLGEAEQQLAQLQAGNRPEVIAQATAQLAEAQSRLAIVKAQLNETRLISPVSGKIAERNGRIGDTTNGQNALFKIIENGRLELRLRVPENQLPLIRVGAPVTITSDANTSLKLSGQVREINPIVDETSRQATVKVDLTDKTGLKPGMFLRGAIVTNTSNSLTVPMTAVLPQKDNQALVYLVGPDNTVTAKTVQLGQIMSNNRVEILTGLQAGDRIVVKGAAYLGDGDKITAISDQ